MLRAEYHNYICIKSIDILRFTLFHKRHFIKIKMSPTGHLRLSEHLLNCDYDLSV